MDVLYIWLICILIVALTNMALMTKIYLKNYSLAKDILRDREEMWKTRGFGLITKGDSAAIRRLIKVIVLRKDPVLIKPVMWFIYVICITVVAIGMVNMAIIFFKSVFNIFLSL